MSRTSSLSGDDCTEEVEGEEGESENGEEICEYERLRNAKVAYNAAILQAALDSANDFNTAIARRKPQHRPKPVVAASTRRSSRLEQQTSEHVGTVDICVENNTKANRTHEGSRESAEQNRDDVEKIPTKPSSGVSPSHGMHGNDCGEDDALANDALYAAKGKKRVASPDTPTKQQRRKKNRLPVVLQKGHFPEATGWQCQPVGPWVTPPQVPSPWPLQPAPNPFGWMWAPSADHHYSIGGRPAPIEQHKPSSFAGPQLGQWIPSCEPQQFPIHEGGPDRLNTERSNLQEAPYSRKLNVLKPDSLKKRLRRESKKLCDGESERRKADGLQPYAVQVRSTGFIDSGCNGVLKWQEILRSFVPKILDMSESVFEKQKEESVKKLRETMDANFQYDDNEITDVAFKSMVARWMRQERCRLKKKNLELPKDKAPLHIQTPQWESLKQHWSKASTQEKSEEMTILRSKVVRNSRVGRRGFKGKEALLRRERGSSPGVTDVAEGLRMSQSNADPQEMNRKNAARMTVLERNQVETKRCLDSLMQNTAANAAGMANLERMFKDFLGRLNMKHLVRNFDDHNTKYVQNDDIHEEKVSAETCDGAPQTLYVGSPPELEQGSTLGRGLDVSLDTPVCKGKANSKSSNKIYSRGRRIPMPRVTTHSKTDLSSKSRAVELRVGDVVAILDPKNTTCTAALGTVTALGGDGMFHNTPIPPQYVRMDLHTVLENIDLMWPNEDAELTKLSHALGSSILWEKSFLSLRPETP